MEGIISPSKEQVGTDTSVFSPLLISMLGIVVTTMAIMAYHLILVKYCIRRYAAAAAEQQAAAPQPSTGVDEKVLQTIPILVFSEVKRGIEQGECVVCLGELEDEETVRLLPNCNHAFHVSCIDQWFAAHANCPMCRSPLQQHETINSAPASPDIDAAEDPNRGGSSENHATPPLRRSASLVTPQQAAAELRSMSRLKRSVSMDQSQSVMVVIDVERSNCASATSFSSASRGILRRSGSLSHFDRVPSKWLRSFSRLRMGKPSNAPILPY